MQFSTSRFSSLMHFHSAPVNTIEQGTMSHVFRDFGLTRSVINNIQQLIRLLADLQRHRACTLAILSGNRLFEEQVRVLDSKISARLAHLDRQPELTEVIDPYQWESVLAEWKVVSGSWLQEQCHHTGMMHNFELQSHLVKTIINLVRDAGRWVLRSGSYSETIADHYLTHSIFQFTFSSHLYQIETLGRLRGLATHIAHQGCKDEVLHSRITFLLQTSREEQLALRALSDEQPACVIANAPAMIDIQLADDAFSEWLQLIHDLLEGKSAPSENAARQVFKLGSQIIDARLALTEQVLGYLQFVIEEMLEAVLEETTQ